MREPLRFIRTRMKDLRLSRSRVAVYAEQAGLAVTESLDGPGYQVTHPRTGTKVSRLYLELRDAERAMARLAPLLDWPGLTLRRWGRIPHEEKRAIAKAAGRFDEWRQGGGR